MADKKTKASTGTNKVPQLESDIVLSFPRPPAKKAEEYLNAYSGYAYTAISSISQEVASIDLKMFKAKYLKDGGIETKEIFQDEILSFLQYINPIMTFYDIVEATQIYLELVGEAFWVVLKEGGKEKGNPKEAYLLRPDWMSVIPNKETIIDHYIYKPGGSEIDKFTIPRENVIHFKYFNPKNPYRGKGSIQAAAMPLDIMNFAQDWNRNFFFNSATPGLVFTTDKKVDDRVIKRFIEQWKQQHEGRDRSHKVAFLSGGFKLDKTSLSAKELDFVEMQKQMRDDILAVFKVPKTILGQTDDVNRANAEATTRAFMERVVTPRMIKLVNTLNEFLLPMFSRGDVFLDFTDPAPDDVDQKLKRYESGRKYGWLTPNEIRVEENLEPVEGGDDITPVSGGGPGGLTAPSAPQGGGGDDNTSDDENEEDTPDGEGKAVKKRSRTLGKPKNKHMVRIPRKRFETIKREKLEKGLTRDITKLLNAMIKDKHFGEDEEVKEEEPLKEPTGNKFQMNEKQREAYWRQYVDKADEWEAQIKQIALDIFTAEEETILNNIEGAKHWKMEKRKASVNSFLQTLVDMAKPWKLNLIPFIREIIFEQGRNALDYLGVGGDIDLTTDEAQNYLNEYAGDLIDGIDETTREKLKKTLAEGFGAGESITELRKRVQAVFTEAKTSRAEKIARSESIRASNFATNLAYSQSEFVVGKEWLTAVDELVCPWCASMDGKIVEVEDNYFEKGDKLTVVNEKGKKQTLKFDLIEVAHPPLHPNCRCTLIPVVPLRASSNANKKTNKK